LRRNWFRQIYRRKLFFFRKYHRKTAFFWCDHDNDYECSHKRVELTSAHSCKMFIALYRMHVLKPGAENTAIPEIIVTEKAVILSLFNGDVDGSAVRSIWCQVSDADGLVGGW